MTAARSTDGSARVSTTKKATAPTPTANRIRRPSRRSMARAMIGARNIATFSPDTAVRWESPVARKSSSMWGSSFDVSPRASPIISPASLASNTRCSDRLRPERSASAVRTKALPGGPRTIRRSTWRLAGYPRWNRYTPNEP